MSANTVPSSRLLQRLEEGLGKDKPFKLWIDSDCACFTLYSELLDTEQVRHTNDVDDGWAICALLNSDRCNIIGISSVYGNDTERISYDNITECLKLHPKGKNIPVFRGSKGPLQPLTGLGGYTNNTKLRVKTNDAVEGLKKALQSLDKASNEKLVIYADGPGTNIATLLLLYPQLRDKIEFVLLFMGRDTADNPAFVAGSIPKMMNLHFTDFNFELDHYSVEILLKSKVSLIFTGAQVALNSMWFFSDDLEKMYNDTKIKNKNNKLIVKLSTKENYIAWLNMFKLMGVHIAPWKRLNGEKLLKLKAKDGLDRVFIDGFIPFGVIAATVLFGSEYLNYKNVNPSLVIVKKNGVRIKSQSRETRDKAVIANVMPLINNVNVNINSGSGNVNTPILDQTGSMDEKVDRGSDHEVDDNGEDDNEDEDEDEDKESKNDEDEMKDLDKKRKVEWNQLLVENGKKLLRSADEMGNMGTFRNAGQSLSRLNRANVLKVLKRNDIDFDEKALEAFLQTQLHVQVADSDDDDDSDGYDPFDKNINIDLSDLKNLTFEGGMFKISAVNTVRSVETTANVIHEPASNAFDHARNAIDSIVNNDKDKDKEEKTDKEKEKKNNKRKRKKKKKKRCFFSYCLCTNDKPQGKRKKSKFVYIDAPVERDNVLYVPSVRIGKFPWKEYKTFVLDLLVKDQI